MSSRKAFVFSNLAISLDGKIATRLRGHFPLGTAEDRRRMQVLRKRSDAVLMGAGTLRAYHRFCGIRGEPPEAQPANVVISTRLEGISSGWEFFREPALRRILVVAQKPAAERARRFERSSELIVLGKQTPRRPAAAQIIEVLGSRGYQSLLVEGGGELMWDFASQDLIDEYHLTLTPKVIGGRDAPTLVEGKGFLPGEVLQLKLAECRVVGDEIYLIYKRR